MLYFEKDTNNETVYGTWMTFKGHCHWQLHNSIGHMLSVVCSNHVPIIHRFWDIRRRIMACHWNLGTGQSPCEFIHELYIAVIYRPGAIFFVADSMRLSSFRSTQPPQRAPEELYRVRWCVTVIYVHPRSSKLLSVQSPYATLSCADAPTHTTLTVGKTFLLARRLVCCSIGLYLS